MSRRAVSAVIFLAISATPALAGFNAFSAGGDNTTASISPTVDSFRAALGDPNNGNTAGPLVGGRREINWDGGGATGSAAAGTPFNGFRNNRGAILTTPGTGFLQTPVDDAALTGINATYATAFRAFSPIRIFVPVGSNISDVTFAIPGTNGAVPAFVRGFGAIFTDVDVANATTLEFFDVNNVSLGTFAAPAGTTADASLSFVGAIANAGEEIARVRITTGNSALGPTDSANTDVAGMDDFLFSELIAIPEPGALAVGAVTALFVRRRRG